MGAIVAYVAVEEEGERCRGKDLSRNDAVLVGVRRKRKCGDVEKDSLSDDDICGV